MTPEKERYCLKENDKLYVFYDKDEFSNTLKRLFFLSQTESVESLASYLGLSLSDTMNHIKNLSIPVDWLLRMAFHLYKNIEVLRSVDPPQQAVSYVNFDTNYKYFIKKLSPADKKNLTASMEKALFFTNPMAIDEPVRKYLDSVRELLNRSVRD